VVGEEGNMGEIFGLPAGMAFIFSFVPFIGLPLVIVWAAKNYISDRRQGEVAPVSDYLYPVAVFAIMAGGPIMLAVLCLISWLKR
jgi:hypothetical protein